MQFEIEKIIKEIRNGNQEAFRKVVEEYQQYAFTLSFRILYDEDEARDAVQDSFIKIWKKIHEYDSKIKFTTWMYRIVTNTAIDRYRSIKRHKSVKMDDVAERLDQLQDGSLEVNLSNEELAGIIKTLADDLPEKQKMVFVLRDIQELSSQEVETILEINETQVKSNLYHARKSIKEKLIKILSFERSLK